MKSLPSGASIEVFETLDSTSAEAKRRAIDGAAGPIWLVAFKQTAGYGRRGREWEQESGDFAGSLLFKAKTPSAAVAQLSFVAALAVYDAIGGFIPEDNLSIKWPNDILIGGAKAAGLLLEMVDSADGRSIIIGVGVNIVSKPNLPNYKTTRLLDHGLTAPVAPADFAAALDRHFWTHYRRWTDEGFASIRALWLQRATGLGSPVKVRLPDETISGIFEDLDESGGLVLRFDGGTRIINAGDVYFGGAAKQDARD